MDRQRWETWPVFPFLAISGDLAGFRLPGGTSYRPRYDRRLWAKNERNNIFLQKKSKD